MEKFQHCDWAAVCHVDGEQPDDGAWANPQKPFIFTSILTAEPGPTTVYKIGRLTFAAAVRGVGARDMAC